MNDEKTSIFFLLFFSSQNFFSLFVTVSTAVVVRTHDAMTLSCMVYSGVGGFVMMCLLGLLTVVAFVSMYAYRRLVTQSESRHPRVFLLDFSKTLVAMGAASLVNYTFTAKVSLAANAVTVRGKSLEGIGWYAAICTMDVVVGTPISIMAGRLLNHVCRYYATRASSAVALWADFLRQNSYYGKYGDYHDVSVDGNRDEVPRVSFAWWYSQTVSWTVCYALSGLLSGLIVLYSFSVMPSVYNPVTWLASSVTFWNLDCLTKQWVVVCFSRGILACLNYGIIDFFNRYEMDLCFLTR